MPSQPARAKEESGEEDDQPESEDESDDKRWDKSPDHRPLPGATVVRLNQKDLLLDTRQNVASAVSQVERWTPSSEAVEVGQGPHFGGSLQARS